MRLTRHTDFSMRVLFYLGVNPDRAVPISEIARKYDISQNHLVKVVHHLVQGGFLTSVRGRSGGVKLARPAEDITLGEVVRYSEPDLRLIDCVGCTIASACTMPRALAEATRAFVAVLDRHNLASLVESSEGLDLILAAA